MDSIGEIDASDAGLILALQGQGVEDHTYNILIVFVGLINRDHRSS